ncbi:hypothetical protein F5I97DRAFT_91417 [Phlebopus sp. FC_14]|nr:hypothetical protein F5I97DRAFT_91417 [Phlebopus sp. FC_14]
MSVRSISGAHVLPDNPTFIDFPVSDGDQSQWPTNTTRAVDSEGHVNFMRPVPLDESLCVKWRCEVGASLASQLKKPAGPTYVLRGWPEGYQMFDHNKGPAGNPRHDAYLIGSRHTKRFRSVPEFIPHALWLLTDSTLNRANCACKYCNKKPQREITASMGLLPKRSTPPSAPPQRSIAKNKVVVFVASSATASTSVRQTRERPTPYAAVRHTPRPMKQPQGPKQAMLRERNSDLRSAYGPGIQLRRWYRDGELLWCALNPPIPGLTGEKDEIVFWPGLVEEGRMKAEAAMLPKTGDEAISGSGQAGGPGESSTAAANGDASRSTLDEDKRVPWTVIQSLSYKVKLLGIPYTYFIPADQVLPYQAHAPSDELIQAIHRVPLEQMNTDADAFRPTDKTTFAEAAAPFALAVQIAANLAGYWTPTDDWEYKFSIPIHTPGVPRPMAAPPRPVNGGQSLDSVMNASMTYNASLTSTLTGAGPSSFPQFPGLPANHGSISGPVALTQTVTQTRYQGLWWGAERIWTDELVRLKLSRAQIAPEGAENIVPPAGPSRKSLEYAKTISEGAEMNDNMSIGAAGRGVFMRLDGLYVADIPKADGSTGKECRATGMLYELVDEDWEGDLAEGAGNSGKGKEKEVSGGAATPQIAVNSTNGRNSPISRPTEAVSSDAQPVDGAASGVGTPVTRSGSAPKDKVRSANEQLSHPILSSPFSLPIPPDGFKFRPILTPGHEAVLSLTLLAGRYYPRILRHPLLEPAVESALNNEGAFMETGQLWALEGLTPGAYNTMDPVRWRPTRVIMVREADKEARRGLEEHWAARARERDERLALDAGYLPPQELPDAVMAASDGGAADASQASAHVSHSDAMEVDV